MLCTNAALPRSYNMLLNIVRHAEGADPEALMARSFRQFQVRAAGLGERHSQRLAGTADRHALTFGML